MVVLLPFVVRQLIVIMVEQGVIHMVQEEEVELKTQEEMGELHGLELPLEVLQEL